MSAGLEVSIAGWPQLQARLRSLSNPQLDRLLEFIGSTVESQTRTRIQREKAAPDGTPWQPWSKKYAARRPAGKSLLQSAGHLLDSIGYEVETEGVRVGSNLVYAKTHQEGRGPIPARPFLGVSEQNERDLADVLERFFGRVLGGAS